ncbi:MAG: glycine zipper 2TM domain-containing protein [Rhodoferax sp.]
MKKQLFTLIGALLLAALAPSASAQTPSDPKAQYNADSKAAQARYEADKKNCNDEASSEVRTQCRRDAKAEYDKALASAKAQLAAATPAASAPAQQAKPACADCGKVTAVTMAEKKGESSPLGLIGGAVLGGVLGHQVGGGTGKTLATVAGAAGGAYAGKKVEEKAKSHNVWTVSVRYGDGRTQSFEFTQDPAMRVGDAVKNSGNSVVRY